ncbi:hypothetical protein LCGC14_2413380 [marine sediment metagenome]|uniref:Uncharacterized protein n=1 Tax=marine sediment metagenome TaxID=412755 RepID=A0A0F9E3Z2_9ZZZZ
MEKINGININVGYTDMDEMPNYGGDPQEIKRLLITLFLDS